MLVVNVGREKVIEIFPSMRQYVKKKFTIHKFLFSEKYTTKL